MAHFVPCSNTTDASCNAWLFLDEFIKLHGLCTSNVSDIDVKFVSYFWKKLWHVIGAFLQPSTNRLMTRVRSSTEVLGISYILWLGNIWHSRICRSPLLSWLTLFDHSFAKRESFPGFTGIRCIFSLSLISFLCLMMLALLSFLGLLHNTIVMLI